MASIGDLAAPKQQALTFRIIFASGIGNIVEWYNFLLYAYLAVVISQLFFPELALKRALVLSFLLFAVGFLARPIGAFGFGLLGDLWGRQKTLLASQALMTLASLGICFLPTYATAGIYAPILLALLRLLQGISVGGEHTTALTYIAEMAPVKQRGLWVSVIPAATAFGILLSSLTIYGGLMLFDSARLLAWGWRVCFCTGFLISLFGLWLRWRLPESRRFLELKQDAVKRQTGFKLLDRHYCKQIFWVMGLVVSQAFFYQLFYIWNPSFFQIFLHLSMSTALLLNGGNMLVFTLAIILGGALSDHFRRRPVLTLMSSALLVAVLWFYSIWVHLAVLWLLLGLSIISIIFGIYLGAVSVVFAEVFPARIRVFLLSLVFNFPFAIVGGFTPAFLSLALDRVGMVGISLAGALIAVLALVCSFGVDDLAGQKI